MKFNIRNISLVLIILLAISALSACTPKIDEPIENNEVLLQNAGFIAMKTEKDGKNYIEIGKNGSDINLEVVDKETFDSIEDNEFYIYTYNSQNILKSLSKNETIKGPYHSSMEQGIDLEEYISPVEKLPVEDLTILDEYEVDFNNDATMDYINMYTSAEKAPNGDIMWDDGQRWLFVVHAQDKDYVLFDDYVQLGQINSYVYTIDEDFYIATVSSGTANLTLKSYYYDRENDMFVETIPFNTEGNVNMLHTSVKL